MSVMFCASIQARDSRPLCNVQMRAITSKVQRGEGSTATDDKLGDLFALIHCYDRHTKSFDKDTQRHS